MADAFLAVATGMSGFRKLCVVKRVREGTGNEPQLRQMLLAEARLASLLEHPNVVQTFEVGEAEGGVYLAMEFLRGQPVHRFAQEIMAKDRVIDPRIAALIVSDALRGLHYVHELRDFDDRALGLIHRDVSPHNLFLTYDGQVKVLDFGIAKLTGDVTSATDAGMVKGKLAYMSPEQASGTPLDRRTDLFGAGIILWELLARQRLYRAATPAETLRRLVAEPTPPLPPDVPAELAQICLHALQKEPDQRYQTAAEMRDAIDFWLSGQPTLRRDALGEKVAMLFATEREEVERLVQEYMRRPSMPIDAGDMMPLSTVPQLVEPEGPASQVGTKLERALPPLPSFERGSPGRGGGSGQSWGSDSAPPLPQLPSFTPHPSFTPPPSSYGPSPSFSPAPSSVQHPPPFPEAFAPPPFQVSVAPPVLAPPPAKGPRTAAAVVAIVLGVTTLLTLVGGALYLGRQSAHSDPQAGPMPSPSGLASAATVTGAMSASAAAPDAAFVSREPPLLRLVGSNTVGAELAPALVEAFLKRRGDTGVHRRRGADDHELAIVATRAGGGEDVVTLRAEGTATAFTALADATTDIGMASRAIKDSEAQLLATKGTPDMRSPATEHVLGLDGIAVIVQANNPVHELDAVQLKKLFAGQVATWKDVGGSGGGIHLYARDDRSGTYDTFKALVLGDATLPPGTPRFDSSEALADAVAADPDALGFTSVSSVRNARAVALKQAGGSAMYPSPFTVSTEGYFLSRRLYLYTLLSASPTAQQFVFFALSSDGQKVVRDAGFVDLDVNLQDAGPCDQHCPQRYAELTKGAKRLSLDFRFRTGRDELDSRATRDFDRLLVFLRGQRGRLRLIGFSDNQGSSGGNVALSLARAKTIAAELDARGVHPDQVAGLGGEMPVASNEDEAGRERNRRVEVWLTNE